MESEGANGISGKTLDSIRLLLKARRSKQAAKIKPPSSSSLDDDDDDGDVRKKLSPPPAKGIFGNFGFSSSVKGGGGISKETLSELESSIDEHLKPVIAKLNGLQSEYKAQERKYTDLHKELKNIQKEFAESIDNQTKVTKQKLEVIVKSMNEIEKDLTIKISEVQKIAIDAGSSSSKKASSASGPAGGGEPFSKGFEGVMGNILSTATKLVQVGIGGEDGSSSSSSGSSTSSSKNKEAKKSPGSGGGKAKNGKKADNDNKSDDVPTKRVTRSSSTAAAAARGTKEDFNEMTQNPAFLDDHIQLSDASCFDEFETSSSPMTVDNQDKNNNDSHSNNGHGRGVDMFMPLLLPKPICHANHSAATAAESSSLSGWDSDSSELEKLTEHFEADDDDDDKNASKTNDISNNGDGNNKDDDGNGNGNNNDGGGGGVHSKLHEFICMAGQLTEATHEILDEIWVQLPAIDGIRYPTKVDIPNVLVRQAELTRTMILLYENVCGISMELKCSPDDIYTKHQHLLFSKNNNNHPNGDI
jgi:hypothetical protein